MKFKDTVAFARYLDRIDPLKKFRSRFHFPKGRNLLYFTGNSLGLQPKTVKKAVDDELKEWARWGVNGHLRASRPWMSYHKTTKKILAEIAGAKASEVVALNHLTVNLHLLMVSFYRPSKQRYKIITEGKAFSSDQYAFESQVRFHGMVPSDAIIEIHPRQGEFTLRTEDILKTITLHSENLALVIFGGVQYYTGQFFDIAAITRGGHAAGAIVGFDLAHAFGNVQLQLHRDDVDFAVWCGYKYLNSGPGGIGGIFVHEKHFNEDLPRFAGWWGHDEKERFKMLSGFKPMTGADGWQLSNYDILPAAAHLAALEMFHSAGMKKLRKKSELLTGYLEFLLKKSDPEENHYQIITPAKPNERGCQLSIFMKHDGKRIFEAITKKGVVADWREPGVIRVAPVPIYNSFGEVYRFSKLLEASINHQL